WRSIAPLVGAAQRRLAVHFPAEDEYRAFGSKQCRAQGSEIARRVDEHGGTLGRHDAPARVAFREHAGRCVARSNVSALSSVHAPEFEQVPCQSDARENLVAWKLLLSRHPLT